MPDALTLLRIANLLVWAGLLVFMFSGVRGAVTGRDVRRGDPMRLGVAAVCVVMILGNLRWLFAPDDELLLAAVSFLSLSVGVFKIILARAYGRGPRL